MLGQVVYWYILAPLQAPHASAGMGLAWVWLGSVKPQLMRDSTL
jgi:hypothetical protein